MYKTTSEIFEYEQSVRNPKKWDLLRNVEVHDHNLKITPSNVLIRAHLHSPKKTDQGNSQSHHSHYCCSAKVKIAYRTSVLTSVSMHKNDFWLSVELMCTVSRLQWTAHNSEDYKRSSLLIKFLTPIYTENLEEKDRGCRLHDQRDLCECMKV